ncbi:NADH-quinone oxidoreductase subunit L [Nocardioides baekrokdamisoli]|uniref:NADH-quinone oxidoreductase subunit L n=1 Tax=Nocardioides baekrokdamisoli TaxID=1804624 RepID=UPI000F773908|nr:NADH-quinone oxidoreductase subunit L [Nocardioides baekrokdamisoli]
MTAVVAVPLVSAVLLLLVPQLKPFGHLIGTAAAGISFAIALILLGEGQRTEHLGTWFHAGSVTVGADLTYDHLSALFLLLITGVGGLIHVYSIGYMAHDERRTRFFAYLNLFIAAMLTLVLAGNYVVLFLGWEGVGLASYLLIGFWQHKPSAAAAALKAFVMNRVGDIGLALAIALMFAKFGTTDIGQVATHFGGWFSYSPLGDQPDWYHLPMNSGLATALGLLLLLAACGKSAQVPLQGWLLDAMEGPTPVSALIHAATMVTAGVYLIVRSHFIFDFSSTARTAVIVVALVTILWGAALGCVKDDIKKVLAGSTMSQIGYMMLAAGIGPAGYPFAIFHLLTHGAFKANMFLGAGSVMHGMGDDVNMKHYGAIRKAMPVTFATFAFGYLAIIGVPPFSGFFSKDKVLEAAFHEHFWIGAVATVGAAVTAFYMTRLMLLTFFTTERWEKDIHPHESPRVMTVPLIALAALSAAGGLLVINDWIVHFLEPVVGHTPVPGPDTGQWLISGAALIAVVSGAGLAWRLFGRREIDRGVTRYVPVPHIEDIIVPGFSQVATMTRTVDTYGVDVLVSGGPVAVAALAGELRKGQNGYVRSYALTMLVGVLIVTLAALAVHW